MCSVRSLHHIHHSIICILLLLRMCRAQVDLDFGVEDSLDSNAEEIVSEARTAPPSRLLRPRAGGCRLSEMLCDTGQCVALDKYCDGEDDCGDKSDEPKSCTPCNRTYIGDVGRTYELEVRRPREEHLPFLCHLNFTAAGGDYGNIVQLTFDTFTVGKFVSFTSDGCPDGHMSIRERSPAPPTGQWCGSAWGYTVYFSESDSVNMTLRLDRLSQQGVGYNFDFKLAYKFLRRSDAKLRYGNASAGAWRGDRVPGTYCDRSLSDCDVRPCRIQSPNFPGVYPRNVTCTYRIEHTRVPEGKHALLAVRQTNSHKINIKDQIVKYDRSQRVLKLWEQCNVVQDYLTVWDGGSRRAPVLARLCGGDAVPDIVSRGPRMLLEFHTSPYDNPFHPVPLSYLPGFELEVQVVLVDRESQTYVRADGRCRFTLRSSDATSGELRNPRHSLPPNTTCVYYFQGRSNEIVWVSFVKYHAAGGEPAGFDQQKDCSSQLSIYDGAAPDADTDDKEGSGGAEEDVDGDAGGGGGALLGSFCREESPRLCDHALLANASRATRPCAPAESYVTTGPALTIVQELRQGSALYPVSFLLRYEFVDVSQQGQPIAGSHTACDRVFRSSHTFSGRFQSPRSIFYYGRGGAQNFTCIIRFESKPGERVRLTFDSARFGNKRCYSHQDPRTGRWKCDRSHRWGYQGTGTEGFAEIIITEYPWEGVPIRRDCLCTNRTEPMTILTLTAPIVELKFTVVNMNITEDYDDFSFEGEYRFVASGPGDEAVCSNSWGERRLRGPSGEIRLLDPRRDAQGSLEVLSDRNIVSESVRAEGARQCVHRPWLIEPSGDALTETPAGYLFLKLRGYELTTASSFCPTLNRILIYDARDPRRLREICPTSSSSATSATVELFSPGWEAEDSSPESVLQSHFRSFVVEFQQREPAEYSLKWIEVTKRPNFIAANTISSSAEPTASLSMDCPYSCPELNACIPPSLWCDGVAHCPSGYDEEDSNCSFRLALPPRYLAAAAGAALLLCAAAAGCACCRRRRRRRRDARLKARLDGTVADERVSFDRLQNGTAAAAEKGLRPPDHHKYATIQKYATLDKYSLSQKYCAGLNDARYYDEVARRDKLADARCDKMADARYASLGRGASAHGGASTRRPPDRAYPDLKDGLC